MIHLVIPDPTPMDPCEVCQEPTETPPLCARCDTKQEETWPTSPIPAGPTANQRTRDEPTSTFPTRVGSGTRQPDAEWDLAERAYERGLDR